jgi:hypothetical protein
MYDTQLLFFGNTQVTNFITVVPHRLDSDGFYKEVIQSLSGENKREWFTPHFYYCLPLIIGNQYGFIIKSTRDFDIMWPGRTDHAELTFTDNCESPHQAITSHFGSGIITVQNFFSLHTEEGINLMTIQPPNMYIEGCVAMTGVVETDNIKRDFTFNIKITVPNHKISIKKGDALGAFIPIPRFFVDDFEVKLIDDENLHREYVEETQKLSTERSTSDKTKPHLSGRRYFHGEHTDGSSYKEHQKKLR